MRLIFLGTPPDAVPPLRALHDAGHDLAFVVTQPDRRRGRGAATGPSPVRTAAEKLGLEVRTPAKSREIVDEVRGSGAELGVIVAFGQLLPPALLEALPLGFVNLHFSLLPRWRGAAPVERAVLAGDAETGVTLMQIDEGLDSGLVYVTRRTPIGEDETAGELRARLVEIGTEVLVEVVPRVAELMPEPQEGEASYAEKLTVEEFRIDPHRPAVELDRLVRAGNPRPGAWMVAGGRRVKVLRAAVSEGRSGAPGALLSDGALVTADGALTLGEVQPEGKRPTTGAEWVRGLRGDRSVS